MIKNSLAAFLLCALSLPAQPPAFPGFTPGNLVVSRSVYTGTAATVAAGQPLPPVCPSTAACKTKPASDSGAYPSLANSNNVFNNDNIDGNFSVTSPIFLDQITPAGTLVNTLPIPSNMIVTSFSSKSELALNLSPDGTFLTFLGYTAPVNELDVSNANTPLVYDPTDPAGTSVFRAVGQIGMNGSIQVTPTNSFSGDNGRAAVLANGFYYMVGNANNGSGTPANVIESTGVQMAKPGQPGSTPPAQVGTFSITQVINPATGAAYTADKPGKDTNFRGLTVFNNTLYITKGSGSNGINTVYQVGNAGSLPTPGNAATLPITILPGLPTNSAKTTTMFPFGIWFANGNTLYVGDEGDGTAADAATSTTAGLQKWVLTQGTWKLVYTMQKGLNLGQAYAVPNYPTSLNPATDGLRNITGRINGDGTVTIWAITSTVSANGDQGADPNQLVSITDTLANTDPAAGTAQSFSILRSAAAGEVLRGVAFAPNAATSLSVNAPLISSPANPSSAAIAAGGLAVANGVNLAGPNGEPLFGVYPTSADGTSVSILDATSVLTPAQLYYTAPDAVGFIVPPNAAAGAAQVTISANGTTQKANVQIAAVAPSVFTQNGVFPSAYALRVSGGNQIVESVFTTDKNGAYIATPINLGSGSDQTFLILFGTGIRAAGIANVSVTFNGVAGQVMYAGPQETPGLDQVNVLIPASLAGKGNVNVQLTAGGIAANPFQVSIQ